MDNGFSAPKVRKKKVSLRGRQYRKLTGLSYGWGPRHSLSSSWPPSLGCQMDSRGDICLNDRITEVPGNTPDLLDQNPEGGRGTQGLGISIFKNLPRVPVSAA